MTKLPNTLVNGVPTEQLDVADRGLQYGDGLFETIAVEGGRPRYWLRHMARIAAGCARLGLPEPDVQRLRFEADHLVQHQERCVLKILITRGSGGRGYRPAPDGEPTRVLRCLPWLSREKAGLKVMHCATPLGRNARLAGIKHLNRLEQVLASRELGDADEGLLADDEGWVIEGTRSNLFLARSGELVTPELTRCGVAGVMRSVVIETCTRDGISVHIGPVSRRDLDSTDELFMTSSLMGVMPVRELDGRSLAVGDHTLRLQRLIATGPEGEDWIP